VRVARGLHGGLSPLQRDRRLVREVLVGCGAAEAMPNPFLAPGDLERCGLPTEAISISNPLVTEESVLRTSLLPGLLKAVAYNASHRSTGVRLFEIGHTFQLPPPGQQLPDEREIVAVALAGAEAPAAVALWDEVAAALAVEGVRLVAAARPGLHPTRTAELRAPNGTVLGAVGEIDPWVLEAHGISERVAWLEFELAALCALHHGERRYRPVSRFPSSDIDLAFVVPDRVPAGDVEDTLRAAGGPLVVDVRLFDVYRGPGIASDARSLAFTLRLQAPDRTLTDADVAAVRQRCLDAVRQHHDAELRA
jgi:phenylalanyl-tRNA synthetase beta chain